MTCQACLSGEHLCDDCGHYYCLNHIHCHPPCTVHHNTLVALRFAVADASLLVDDAIQLHLRLQNALKLLEESLPARPAEPTLAADKIPSPSPT